MTRIASLLIILVAAPPVAAAAPHEALIESLLGRMTLSEKLGQLQQLDGNADGTAKPELFELARKGALGSTLNVRGAREVNALQRAAVEGSRLKIPLLFAFDVIHGYRTVFPVPLAEAASWDPGLAGRTAAAAAAEAAAAGVKWTFAPMVDIARDARWGRVVEGAGEDPYLGAAFARARVEGFQGADASAPDRVAACAKHLAGYGAAQAGRDYNSVDLSERTLREVYFPPFQAALGAGVMTVMTAFNDLNGIPSTANGWLLRGVLRGEWGYPGLVVSDYTAVRELIAHGAASGEDQAAILALEAGVDVEMVSRLYASRGPALAKAGSLPLREVNESVRRVLRLKAALGLFDRPYADEAREAKVLLTPAHLALAQEAAARSLVLLKNEPRVLPFPKTLERLAVIGPLADDPSPLGSWPGDGRKEDVVTVLAALKAKLPGAQLAHVRGCDAVLPEPATIAAAVEAARWADAVVLVLGETAELSGEAASRADLRLPGRQLELAEAVLAANPRAAVVLMNGRPLAIEELAAKAPAILEAWFGGLRAGPAIADALFGDANPGGKLPVTFPRAVGQVPLFYAHRNTGRPPGPDKYTSKYLDVPVEPLFPFGHGLSYTSFELSGLEVSPARIRQDGRAKVRVTLANTGTTAGDEVVQLYVRGPAFPAVRPVKELKGFERVRLEPKARRVVEFELGPDELRSLNEELTAHVAAGRYRIEVGTSSAGGRAARLDVE